jgi:hypothetical protein
MSKRYGCPECGHDRTTILIFKFVDEYFWDGEPMAVGHQFSHKNCVRICKKCGLFFTNAKLIEEKGDADR